MPTNVYSFEQVNLTINHTGGSTYTVSGAGTGSSFNYNGAGATAVNGYGIGSIVVNFSADRTVHDVAADGNVMISKINNRTGSIAIKVQQTSELNKFFNRLYAYTDTADASKWASVTCTIQSTGTNEIITATGCSLQKATEKTYEAQGQQVTWTLMSANISIAVV